MLSYSQNQLEDCSEISQTKRPDKEKAITSRQAAILSFPKRGNTIAAVDVRLELDAEGHTAPLFLPTNTALTGWRHSRQSP